MVITYNNQNMINSYVSVNPRENSKPMNTRIMNVIETKAIIHNILLEEPELLFENASRKLLVILLDLMKKDFAQI
jgi:hypothetical protein